MYVGPDAEAQPAIRDLFGAFAACGSAYAAHAVARALVSHRHVAAEDADREHRQEPTRRVESIDRNNRTRETASVIQPW